MPFMSGLQLAKEIRDIQGDKVFNIVMASQDEVYCTEVLVDEIID